MIYAILALAFGLRLIAIGQSLWLDEAISAIAVREHSLISLLTGYLAGDFSPPLYFILQWFWVRMFGTSEIALRIPSVLYGVGAVYFVYLIAGLYVKDKNSKLPELAALLTALNPLLIYYSQEARMYSLTAFTITVSVYFFLLHRRTKATKYFLFFFGSFSAALYSHYLTWFMLPVFGLWGVRYVTPFLAIVPWIPQLSDQLRQGSGAASNLAGWADLSALSFRNIFLVPVKFVSGRISFLGASTITTGLIALVTVVFWVTAVIGIKTLWPKLRKIRDTKHFLILWLFIPLVLSAAFSIKVPVFSYFRFLFIVPAAILLFVVGVGAIRKSISNIVFAFVVLVSVVFSLTYLVDSSNHREDWKSAVEFVHGSSENEIYVRKSVRAPFDYYDQGKSTVYDSIEDMTEVDSFWYFPYAGTIFDPTGELVKRFSESGFVKSRELSFREMQIHFYESRN